jgi:hypothetical protein
VTILAREPNVRCTAARTLRRRDPVRRRLPGGAILEHMKHELDSRITSHGDQVVLVWYPVSDQVEIEVTDGRLGFVRSAPVPKSCALDAFRHPYLYLESTVALAA